MEAVLEDPTVFTQPTAMDTLGVGSKMVKSIRFWMQASGLTEEIKGSGKRQQRLTPDFGAIIADKDFFFEDITTLWLLHAKIVSRFDLCTAWYLFFNAINAVEFEREDIMELLSIEMDKRIGTDQYSTKSLADDIFSIIRMYTREDGRVRDPEENLSSPFADLGLLQRSETTRRVYKKTQPSTDSLDKLVIMYVLIGALEEGQNAISIDDLLYKPCSVGRIFNISRPLLYEYLDRLRSAKLITLNRTAGLDMVYIPENLQQVDILKEYYQ